ncbi:unnamed protein product [Closterium sp. NIES-53]
MLALCREQRLEHRTKHIALRYFLARELQQRGQLRLAYVASEANTADVFTKALAPLRRGEEEVLLLDFHATPLLCSLPLPPPRPQQRVLQGEKGREEGSWWRFASHPRHPFTLPPPCQQARQGERWGVAATAKAARASGVLSHGLLLRVRVALCALAAAACAHVLAFATAAVRTAVRTAAARAGDCYARRRARCCYARLCVLPCDGARDGLRTAGAFATVNGAFATGRTLDEAMTRDGAANGDADDQRKSRRAGRRSPLPVGRDVTNLARPGQQGRRGELHVGKWWAHDTKTRRRSGGRTCSDTMSKVTS